MNEERNLTIEEETNGNNIDMNSLFGTAAKHGDKLTAEYSDGVEYEAATEEAAEETAELTTAQKEVARKLIEAQNEQLRMDNICTLAVAREGRRPTKEENRATVQAIQAVMQAEEEAKAAGIDVDKLIDIGYEAYCGESLPQEEPPRNSSGLIVGTAAQKENERQKAIDSNIKAVINGEIPRFIYDRDNDCYIEHKDGIPGVKRFGRVVDLSGIISRSIDEFLRDYTARNGRGIILDQLLDEYDNSMIKAEYWEFMNRFIQIFNENRTKEEKIAIQKSFPIEAVTLLLIKTEDLAILYPAGASTDIGIGYYHHTGDNAGLWAQGGLNREERYDFIVKVAGLFGVNTAGNYYDRVYKALRSNLPKLTVKNIDGVIPAKNGAVDIRNVICKFNEDKTDWTGEGFEFTPYLLDNGEENPDYLAKYKAAGFMAKLPTDFNPNAEDKVFSRDGYEWSVMKGIREVTEDGERKKIAVLGIFETINSCIRGKRLPHTMGFIDWTKNEGFEGGGGKTTVFDMIKYVLGGKPLVFSRDIDTLCGGGFGLEGLESCTIRTVLCDESDSVDEKDGLKSGKAFKKLTRPEQDITINPKGTKMIDMTTDMPIVIAANRPVKSKPKDEASKRPLIYTKFPKNFTNCGVEKSYIRNEYVKTKEVREFVLLKALSLGLIPDFSEEVVEIGKQYRNEGNTDIYPVFQYLDSIRYEFQGKTHPVKVIYEDYKLWCKMCGHNACSYNEFINYLRVWVKNSAPGWKVINNEKGFYFPKNPPPELYAGRVLEAGISNDTTRKFLANPDGTGRAIWNTKYQGLTAPGACLYCDDSYLDNPPVLSAKEEMQMYCIWAAVDCALTGKTWNMRRTMKEWIEKGKERVEFPVFNGNPSPLFTPTTKPTTTAETEPTTEAIEAITA